MCVGVREGELKVPCDARGCMNKADPSSGKRAALYSCIDRLRNTSCGLAVREGGKRVGGV